MSIVPQAQSSFQSPSDVYGASCPLCESPLTIHLGRNAEGESVGRVVCWDVPHLHQFGEVSEQFFVDYIEYCEDVSRANQRYVSRLEQELEEGWK